jgi:hypothetical protein
MITKSENFVISVTPWPFVLRAILPDTVAAGLPEGWPCYATGTRASIQSRMSFSTPSLPMSFRRSW